MRCAAVALVMLLAALPGCTTVVADGVEPKLDDFAPTDPDAGEGVEPLDPGPGRCDAGVVVEQVHRHHELSGRDESYSHLFDFGSHRLVIGRTIREQREPEGEWDAIGEAPNAGSGEDRYAVSGSGILWRGGDSRSAMSLDGGATFEEVLTAETTPNAFVSGTPFVLENGSVVFGGEGVLYVVGSPGTTALRVDVPELDSRPDWHDGPSVTALLSVADAYLAVSKWGVVMRADALSGPWLQAGEIAFGDDRRPHPLVVERDGTLIAATNAGDIYESTDVGATWTHITAIEPSPHRGNRMVVVGSNFVRATETGIQWSADNGHSWKVCDLDYTEYILQLEPSFDGGGLWVVDSKRIFKLRFE